MLLIYKIYPDCWRRWHNIGQYCFNFPDSLVQYDGIFSSHLPLRIQWLQSLLQEKSLGHKPSAVKRVIMAVLVQKQSVWCIFVVIVSLAMIMYWCLVITFVAYAAYTWVIISGGVRIEILSSIVKYVTPFMKPWPRVSGYISSIFIERFGVISWFKTLLFRQVLEPAVRACSTCFSVYECCK